MRNRHLGKWFPCMYDITFSMRVRFLIIGNSYGYICSFASANTMKRKGERERKKCGTASGLHEEYGTKAQNCEFGISFYDGRKMRSPTNYGRLLLCRLEVTHERNELVKNRYSMEGTEPFEKCRWSELSRSFSLSLCLPFALQMVFVHGSFCEFAFEWFKWKCTKLVDNVGPLFGISLIDGCSQSLGWIRPSWFSSCHNSHSFNEMSNKSA